MLPEPHALAERYVAVWNESDPVKRAEGVRELYAPDIEYVMYRRDPFHGWDALLEQITFTYDLYRPMGFAFQYAGDAVGHHHLVRFGWMMRVLATGEVEMTGQNVVVLDEQGRIRADYQFHDRLPTSFIYNDGFDETGAVTRKAQPTWLTT